MKSNGSSFLEGVCNFPLLREPITAQYQRQNASKCQSIAVNASSPIPTISLSLSVALSFSVCLPCCLSPSIAVRVDFEEVAIRQPDRHAVCSQPAFSFSSNLGPCQCPLYCKCKCKCKCIQHQH